MTGSNGFPGRRGPPPPHWPAEGDEQAQAREEAWRQSQPPYPPGASGSQPQQGYRNDGGYAPPPFDPAAHPQPAPHPGLGHLPPHAAYTPSFERFAPPQQPAQPPPADPFGRYEPPPFGVPQHNPHAASHHPAPPPFDLSPGPPQAPAYGHQPAPHFPPPYHAPQAEPPFEHAPRPHDARGDVQSWDLSQYHPAQAPPGYAHEAPPAPHADPAWAHQHGGAQHDGAPHGWPPQQPPPWQPHHPYPPGHEPYDQHGQHAYSPQLDPAMDPHGRQHGAHPGHDPHAQYEAEEHEPPEPVRRGPSTLVVVGLLVGAIVVGGGLAFAYKQVMGGGGGGTKVAEVKRQTTPDKVRPKDPGGKQIEHSDKKFLNRLASEPAETQRQSDIDGAAKKVSTIPIVVNRDGTLSPQVAPPPVSNVSSVPGLVLDGFGPPPRPVAQAPAPQPPPAPEPPPLRGDSSLGAPPPARQPPPPPPRVADLPLPRVISTPPPPPSPPPAAVAQPIEKAAPPKKRVAVARDDLMAPQGAAPVASDADRSGLGSAAAPPRRPAPSSAGNGYVAVLASKKSRQDALNSFADLHSQYPDVLSGLTPDVREANLGDKGVWYRLIVGPPGSREAARSVCVKLKERGMKDCWPVAY